METQHAHIHIHFQPTIFVMQTPQMQDTQSETSQLTPEQLMAQSPEHIISMLQAIFGQATPFAFPQDESNQPRARPASLKAIAGLPFTAPSETLLHEPCPVCTDELYHQENTGEDGCETSRLVLKMPCGHHFHSDCLTQWLARSNQCPMCRYELDTDDDVYNQKVAHKRNQERST
jgi:hypothetical protein